MSSPISHQFTITAGDFNYESQYHHQHHMIPAENIFDDDDQVPSPSEFDAVIEDYLRNLSPKKRDKALVDQHRYQQIHQVLMDPRNTTISTAQFRFWVKKMFELQPGTVDLVCHDGKPVAMREQIYTILVKAHREAHHGGRDKTSALVRRKFSWIPKELVARFVRHCPFCITRRNGGQSPLGTYKRIDNSGQHLSTAYNPSITMAHHGHHNNSHPYIAATVPPMLCTPLMQDDSDIASSGPPSTEHGYDASPNYNIASPTRRSTHVVYDRDEEDLLKSYHHHCYGSPSEGFHQYAFDMMNPSKVTTTGPMTITTNDHAPSNTSELMTTGLSPSSTSASAAATALFYQQHCMPFSSYYYPNILGIAPCDNDIATTTATTTTTANTANNIAVAEFLKADATGMLAQLHPQNDISTDLPFTITTAHPPDHFIPSIPKDNINSTTPQSLLPSYD